jgi:hypothetical protein
MHKFPRLFGLAFSVNICVFRSLKRARCVLGLEECCGEKQLLCGFR